MIGRQQATQRLPTRDRNLLASAPPDVEARFGIEPLDALVIDLLPDLSQLQIDHAGTIGGGMMLYEQTYVLGNGWGHICIGGQKDTVANS